MASSSASARQEHPIIGCTSYRRSVRQNAPFEMRGVASAYVQAVIASGGIPLLIPIGLSESDLRSVFERIDGLLLPGGGDVDPCFYEAEERHEDLRGLDKARDELELFMARLAVSHRKPMLAICRGHQVFNVALGGTLWQDVESQMPGAIKHDYDSSFPRNHMPHPVEVCSDTKLAHSLGCQRVAVNSMHHQGIRDLAPDLVATATTVDGLIEGVEVPGHPFAVGVQWHPENLIHDSAPMLGLFKGLVEAAVSGR